MLRVLATFGICVTSFACTPPPEAPDTFDELTSYLMIHFDDEDPAALQAGMTNMQEWLGNNSDALAEGYQLSNLTPEAVESIPEDCPAEGQIGAGASFEVHYPIEDFIDVALAHDPMDVYEGSFNFNERIFVDDLDCFLEQSCEKTEYHSHIENKLPLSIELEVWMATQIRWIELEDGPSALFRNWMTAPAISSLEWIDINQQYGIGTLYSTDTGIHKLEAGWIDMALGDIEVPENLALILVVDTIVDSGAKLQDYMDGLQ